MSEEAKEDGKDVAAEEAPEATKDTTSDDATRETRSRPRARRAAPPAPARGALGARMTVFVIVVGGLAAGFAFLGKEGKQGGAAAPKWRVGQEALVEITVVPQDKTELACASPADVGGRKCQFETQSKAHPPAEDPAKVLKPYTTTDQVQFLAAGLWEDPALKTLPTGRFSVKCKYKVEGEIDKPGIRWASDGPWYTQTNKWYAGSVSGCSIVQ